MMNNLIFLVFVVCIGCSAQTPRVKKTTVVATSPASGKDMYFQYCAACHGKNGKGDGPAAAALKTPPMDLTKLSANNDGRFPEVKVVRIIEGSDTVAAHGSRDMPVWGEIFHHMDASPATAKVRLANLSPHIQSIQRK
jgi:mono/diheme cytochrome c family protein